MVVNPLQENGGYWGNDTLNVFLSQCGSIPKGIDIVIKYRSKDSQIYREKIKELSKGSPWQAPLATKKGDLIRKNFPQN